LIDDPTQRLLISSVFGGRGLIVEAEDAEDGLKAKTTCCLMIVCDVSDAGLNGYESLSRRWKDPLCFIPVIMLTPVRSLPCQGWHDGRCG
jgi:CheY-like chemotaxis protein